MDIKEINNTNSKNSFITYTCGNNLKYIIYAKDLKVANSDIISSNYHLHGVALCFLVIDSNRPKNFVWRETNFVLNVNDVSQSSEEEIRELYKYLKYGRLI